MGFRITANVAPYVAHSVFETTNIDYNNEFQCWLGATEAVFESECDWQQPPEDYSYENWVPIFNGWYCHGDSFAPSSQGEGKESIWSYSFSKDEYCIYLVNESQSANGGEVQIAVVAENPESIEEFCKDWNISLDKEYKQIKQDDIIYQQQ